MGIDKNKSKLIAAAELRRHAEEQLKANMSEAGFPLRTDEMQRLLHELQLHHLELEMQNAELRQARDEVEESLEKYTDLYDFAPVGYFTLDRNGSITSANLSAAGLLGVERSRLIGRRFELWVTEEYRPAFAVFLERVYTSLGKEVCEVALLKKKEESRFFVQIEAMDNASGQECRLALINITDRKLTEESLRSRALRMIVMEEELRKNLAAELHDELGRDLTALGLNFTIISNALSKGSREKLSKRIQDSSLLIEEMGRTVREMMVRLRPPVLDDYGLAAALRWQADLFAKQTGISINIQMEEIEPRLSDEIETAFFRIAKEALANIAKHADAWCVTLILGRYEGRVRLSISDDGRGFDSRMNTSTIPSAGWGLTLMRERAESVGASFFLDSKPGLGTVVSVETGEVC